MASRHRSWRRQRWRTQRRFRGKVIFSGKTHYKWPVSISYITLPMSYLKLGENCDCWGSFAGSRWHSMAMAIRISIHQHLNMGSYLPSGKQSWRWRIHQWFSHCQQQKRRFDDSTKKWLRMSWNISVPLGERNPATHKANLYMLRHNCWARVSKADFIPNQKSILHLFCPVSMYTWTSQLSRYTYTYIYIHI